MQSLLSYRFKKPQSAEMDLKNGHMTLKIKIKVNNFQQDSSA